MSIRVDGRWHQRFMALAQHVATWSKDDTGCGAVLVDDRIVIGLGYNGFPRGVRDDPERYADRETKLSLVVHAEVNAILNASSITHGASLYVTRPPCSECMKTIIQARIACVYHPPQDPRSKWRASHELAEQMALEAGVLMREVLPTLVVFRATRGERVTIGPPPHPHKHGCQCHLCLPPE